MTDKKMEWEVVSGFGDTDSPADCWDVEVIATFKSEADADVFADLYYENRISDVQERMPDWWKSYWVTARRIVG